MERSGELDDLIAEIEESLDAEEFEAARDRVDRALARFPRSGWLHGLRGEALSALGDEGAALAAYREAIRVEPDSAELGEALADCCFRAGLWDEARAAAERAVTLDGQSAGSFDILAYLAEREGRIEEADKYLRRAHEADPEVTKPNRLDAAAFREHVTEALDQLPSEFAAALEKNVAIVVEHVPTQEMLRGAEPPLDPTILGYYVGVPLPEREPSLSSPPLPDVIYLFQRNLEHVCGTRGELIDEIATTLYHEVAHYFGFEEDEMEDLGLE